MKLNKKMFFSKKIIVFLFMIILHTISSASDKNDEKIFFKDRLYKVSVLTQYSSHLNEYYISIIKTSGTCNFEIKHNENFSLPLIKDISDNSNLNFIHDLFISKNPDSLYIIATDINRSLRN